MEAFTALDFFGLLSLGIIVAGGVYASGKKKRFIAFLKENQALIVVKPEAFHKARLSSRKFALREDAEKNKLDHRSLWSPRYADEDVGTLPTDVVSLNKERNNRSLYWIGIYPFFQAKTYQLIETTLKQRGSSEGVQIKTLTKETDYDHVPVGLMVRVLIVRDAEIQGSNARVDALFVVTMRHTNVYVPIFEVVGSQWIEALFDQMGTVLRGFLGRHEFDDFRKEKTSGEQIMHFLRTTQSEDGEDDDHILHWLKLFRVLVIDCQIEDVDFTGDEGSRMREAATAVYVQEQQGKAEAVRITTVAKAEAERERRLGKAKAYARQVEYEAIKTHKDGAHIRRSEAIENASANFLSLGDDRGGLSIALPSETKPKKEE